MRRERTGNGGTPSPEERYRDFAKDNDRWDRKVKESIDKIEKASRRDDQKRDAVGR
jgi:hypothetical protein